jgi:hypothetical protein
VQPRVRERSGANTVFTLRGVGDVRASGASSSL